MPTIGGGPVGDAPTDVVRALVPARTAGVIARSLPIAVIAVLKVTLVLLVLGVGPAVVALAAVALAVLIVGQAARAR